MIRFLRSTLYASAFHSHGKKPPFFKGRYHKVVDTAGEHRYAIIPGLFLSGEPDQLLKLVR